MRLPNSFLLWLFVCGSCGAVLGGCSREPSISDVKQAFERYCGPSLLKVLNFKKATSDQEKHPLDTSGVERSLGFDTFSYVAEVEYLADSGGVVSWYYHRGDKFVLKGTLSLDLSPWGNVNRVTFAYGNGCFPSPSEAARRRMG